MDSAFGAAPYQAARTLAGVASRLARLFAQIRTYPVVDLRLHSLANQGQEGGAVMCRAMLRHTRVPGIALLVGLVLTGCGKSSLQSSSGEGAPAALPPADTAGAGAISTKNTTRIGGTSPAVDAAALARTVYPGITPSGRPQAVVLVDGHNWPGALAASVLEGAPLRAPLLYSEGIALGSITEQALAALQPSGAATLEGAQEIRVGEAAAPSELRVHSLPARGGDPARLAVEIERLQAKLRGHPPRRVIITAWDAPAAMTEPAAGLAALTSAPILFVRRSGMPAATRAELRRLRRAAMYVVGPGSVVSDALLTQLRAFGPVTRIAAPTSEDPVSNAIAVARFSDGSFGWGAQEAGHGFVFALASQPFDGPPAAGLAASGDFAPLLLLQDANRIPPDLAEYVSNLQPGYPPSGPVHGVYNHGWLIGDARAISPATQATLDAMLEINPHKTSTEPAAPELESPPPSATTTTG
jgi:hypothetical protein